MRNEVQSYFSNIGLNLAMSVIPDGGNPTLESLPRDQIGVSLHLRLVTVDEIKENSHCYLGQLVTHNSPNLKGRRVH